MSDAVSSSAPAPTPTPPPSGQSNVTTSPAAPQQASPQTQEMFEVKVNGRTVKMTRQEVLDSASMSHAANDKFNEAKKQRSEVDRIISSAKKNPIEALMDPALGLTKDQVRDAFEKWYAKEFIEPDTLNADQKQLRAAEERLRKYEEKEKENKQKEETDAQEKMTTQQREYLQGQIIEALDKSNLPKTPQTVSRIAFYMRQNLMNGWDAPMDMIVRQVQKERQESFRSEAQASTVEQVIDLLGEDFVNKIRKHDLEQLRKKRELPPVDSSAQQRRSDSNDSVRISSAEVNRRLRDMRLGKI